MPGKRFKVYLDNQPAPADWLARVLSISVDQEVDHTWEAHVTLPLCLGDDGSWSELEADLAHTRIRIELQVGNQPWVPLIDGPVVGHETSLHSEPGRSQVVLRVHDDSALLNLTEVVTISDGRSDSEIARQLFTSEQVSVVPETIAPLHAPADPLEGGTVQRGTNANFLRRLAERNGLHAYVLPGAIVGAPSRGFFCSFPDPTTSPALPPLVLLGAGRNVATFEIDNDSQAAGAYRVQSLSLGESGTFTGTGSFANETLLGGGIPDTPAPPASRLLPPTEAVGADADARALAQSIASSYTYAALGTVYPGRYAGILVPYQLITVQAGGTSLSGTYLLKRVRHAIGRSEHNQEFTVQRQVRAALNPSLNDLASSIF